MRGPFVLVLVALVAVAVSASSPAPAHAAEATVQTVNAPVERVWTTTVGVLKQLGWDIAKEDRSIGWISTESRNIDGEDYAVYAKSIRHKLTVHIKSIDAQRTSVSIERAVFKRERILWIDKDEPLTVSDRGEVEKSVLVAIRKAL